MAKKPQTPRTNIHAIFATDKKLEEDGAWVEVNGLYGLEIKVRRAKSDPAAKCMERLIAETLGEGKIRRPQDIKAEQFQDLIRRQYAEAILIDWKNLRDLDTGEDIPYSVEMAYILLGEGDFMEFVRQAAEERDAFRSRSDEEAEGN